MKLPLNHNEPLLMHIDLNSCFASVEQQASPHLRGRPVVVAAYASANGCVVSPSIEAKQLGIKTGMTVRDARIIYPDVIVRTPDPAKYRHVHKQFAAIFHDYSPDVTPKSIDEAVIDFTRTKALYATSLTAIAQSIKRRMQEEIGEWIRCSVGIGTNRFLAKTGAGLHKPDGLDVITHKNLRDVYNGLSLIDLCGINTRYQARLNACGIFTPLQFLDASVQELQKDVFQSIAGYYWYMRLRGWEIDEVEFKRKSFGQSYALGKKTADPKELRRLLMKLTEKMARRLRKAQFAAKGVHVACVYTDWTYWHKGKIFERELYTTEELFKKVMLVFNMQPQRNIVAKLAVSCFDLVPSAQVQESLFDTDFEKKRKVSDCLDAINDKYGEYVITPALMMGMDDLVIDRIAFGGVKELQEVYE
jgi:DNA polymerase-4